MELYITRDGQQHGPYSEDQVRQYLEDGTLTSSDLAWHEGAQDWSPLSSLLTFSRHSAPPPAPAPANRSSREVDLPEISADSLGGYARSTLQPNETPLYKTTIHWIIFLRSGFLALVCTLFLALPLVMVQESQGSHAGWLGFLLPAFILLPAMITYLTSELVITDKRVLIKVGFVRRRTIEMFISKIESIGVNQGILGRLFDYGTVTIRGTGGSAEPFKTIAHPLQFRGCVQRVQSHSESKP